MLSSLEQGSSCRKKRGTGGTNWRQTVMCTSNVHRESSGDIAHTNSNFRAQHLQWRS